MITLPPSFEKDIQGQSLELYPIVKIDRTYSLTLPEGTSMESTGIALTGTLHESLDAIILEDAEENYDMFVEILTIGEVYRIDDEYMQLTKIVTHSGNVHLRFYYYFGGVLDENSYIERRGLFGSDRVQHEAGAMIYRVRGANLFVSTKSTIVDNTHYMPLLLNIPSITESMDFENRNYKISNVNLQISNYEYEGRRFSDHAGSLINSMATISWVSPSDSILEVYKGVIRRYLHDDEKCTLQLEDSTQKDLHRDVPIAKLGATEDVPDKYKLKPIPMVYGEVDNSPLVIKEFILSTGEGLIVADNTEFGAKIVTDAYDSVNPLKISSDDSYHHILKSSVNYSRWGYDSSNQYIHSDGDGFVTFISPFTSDTLADNVENESPLADNAAEAIAYVNPNRYKLFSAEDNYTYGEVHNGFGFYEAVNIGDEVTTGHNFFVDDSGEYDPGTMKHYYYKLTYYFDPAFDAFDDDYYSKFSYDVDLSLTEVQRMDTSVEHYHQFLTGRSPDVHSHHEHFSTDDVSENLVGTTLGIGDGWANTSEKEIRILCGWKFVEWSPSSGDIMECQTQIIINKIQLEVNYLKKDFTTSDFYANVKGRTHGDYEA